jgi:hypothetical protein
MWETSGITGRESMLLKEYDAGGPFQRLMEEQNDG